MGGCIPPLVEAMAETELQEVDTYVSRFQNKVFGPISLWATLCSNPPRSLPMHGVITHIYNPYKRTA